MLAENVTNTDLEAITDPIIIRKTDGSYQYVITPSRYKARLNVTDATVITALNGLTFGPGANSHFLPATDAVSQYITLSGGHAL